VAHHADTSGSLALARRPRQTTRMLPQPGHDRLTPNGPGALPQDLPPAEIAQARIFEELLRTELVELQDLTHRMKTLANHEAETKDPAPSFDPVQISERIEEILGLLKALKGRFPHTPTG
jgi:hypothetical protein